jgi:hypothetical protein
MEAQAHPLVVAIPRFIQIGMPLSPLKPMDQSRCGVARLSNKQQEYKTNNITP